MAGFLPESGVVNDCSWKELIVPPTPQPGRLKNGEWKTRRSWARVHVHFVTETVSLGIGHNDRVSQIFHKQDVQELIAFLQEVEKQL